MTAFLPLPIPAPKNDPAEKLAFFDAKDLKKIHDYFVARECPAYGFPPSCDANLFFGFFFDGTNNNLKRDRDTHSHSNVARLYGAFPGGRDEYGSEPWPGLKTKYHNGFFRTYVPGAGTRFDDVGDSGAGTTLRDDRPRGLAFCYKGQNRIVWAMVQAINNLHKYYLDGPMIDRDAFQAGFNRLELPRFGSTLLDFHPPVDGEPPTRSAMDKLEVAFTEALQTLHGQLSHYLPVGPGKSRDRGIVRHIYASMFGFSRGAVEARAFSNWFVWLCRLDARLLGVAGLSLGGIPVTVDFLGLFDSVASVGLASSFLIADGHQAWADAETSLRIPAEIAHCLHLVAGHEIRRSFPLDSVLVRGSLPANCREVVFPGVHSDIGGGYRPGEQGRGDDPQGADLLSRLPLALMYRAARLAGVPLKLEEAPDSVRRDCRIAPSVIARFNGYLAACGAAPGQPVSGPLQLLMAQQHKRYIQWRKAIRGKMASLPGFARCSPQDQADLLLADKEFGKEVACFEAWRRNRGQQEFDEPPAIPEWQAIDAWWDEPAPAAAIADLLARCVHDSRAWFKPLGQDVPDLQHQMEALALQAEKERVWAAAYPYADYPNPYALMPRQREALVRYLDYPKRADGKADADAGLPIETGGREPLWLGAGYLRYRKIYMGSDSCQPADAVYAGVASPADRRLMPTSSWRPDRTSWV